MEGGLDALKSSNCRNKVLYFGFGVMYMFFTCGFL